MGSTIVTAVGVAVQSRYGLAAAQRLQAAMEAAVQACLAEGLSLVTDADPVRQRTADAHDRVLADLADEHDRSA